MLRIGFAVGCQQRSEEQQWARGRHFWIGRIQKLLKTKTWVAAFATALQGT
jgi:hypothetical protein